MIRLGYLPLAIIAISPATGFAHKVPFGSEGHCAATSVEAAEEGTRTCTEEDKAKSKAAAFCKFTGRTDPGCAESIMNHGMAEHAGKCVDEALQKQVDIKEELIGHKWGGGGTSSEGHWHTDYRYSKQEGWHRHDWSHGARDVAGRDNGTAAVRQAKENSSVNKTITEDSKAWGFVGRFATMIGLGGVASVDHEASVNHTGSKSTTVEAGPLTEALAQQIYDEAYALAYINPNVSKVNPDITCERDKPKCSSSFSSDVPNKDYKPQGSKPAGGNESGSSKGSGSSSGSSSSGSQGGNNSTPPKTSSNDTDIDIEHTHAGSYAGDPSPVTKPGEMLATYSQDNFNDPVARCLFESWKKEVTQDANKTYNPDGPNKTPAQRKKEAEGLLRQGICDAKYFGPAFCQKHKTLKLATTHTQDPQPEKTTTVFDQMKDLGHVDFGNPNDFLDKTPIDLSKQPKTSPDGEKPAPIKLKP